MLIDARFNDSRKMNALLFRRATDHLARILPARPVRIRSDSSSTGTR